MLATPGVFAAIAFMYVLCLASVLTEGQGTAEAIALAKDIEIEHQGLTAQAEIEYQGFKDIDIEGQG